MREIIKIEKLNKSYYNKKVLDDVNISIEKGKIYGIVGRSGAGKTTLLRSLLNMTPKDSGIISVHGKETDSLSCEYLEEVGYLVGNEFYSNLNVEENLDIHCEYYGFYKKEKVEEYLEILDLVKYKEKKIYEIPSGVIQKLAFVRAIVPTPKILILDEPFISIDYKDISIVRDIIFSLNEDFGTTVILTSQVLSEIELIADNVIFIDKGRVEKEIYLKDKDSLSSYIVVKCDNSSKAMMILEKTLNINSIKLINGNDIAIMDYDDTASISKSLVENGVGIYEIFKKKVNLEKYLTK